VRRHLLAALLMAGRRHLTSLSLRAREVMAEVSDQRGRPLLKARVDGNSFIQVGIDESQARRTVLVGLPNHIGRTSF
jgi:hypothetical protein